MKYIIISLCWILYFTIHSILADDKIKKSIYKTSYINQHNYRIIFNLIAIGLLLPLVYFTFIVEDVFLIKSTMINRLGIIITIIGVFFLIRAFMSFNLKEFFGFEQLQKHTNSNTLVVSGMYKYVRHPLYFALILIFAGIFCIIPTYKTLIINIIEIIYLIIGSTLEENKLEAIFGEDYIKYKKTTKKLMPFIY
jgi:protein-S-isoprenylcysteine O-methyltransferase Ste14